MNIAMIPARLGSQRLVRKNLQELGGVPLITRAIRKCKAAGCFDEIWVNSESDEIGALAEEEGAQFHQRPEKLASDTATSEDFVYEFIQHHPCETVFQVHSIAPLLGPGRIKAFVDHMVLHPCDVLLSYVPELIECAFQDDPVNFTYDVKTNSQDLKPIQRVTWSITGWRSETFTQAHDAGRTATYAGTVDYYPIDRIEGLIIKTESDLAQAEALLPLIEDYV
ncbi:MAG: cytidyltransferase [Candidatus Hydrogenedentota bacterium]|nr:MAG: cytidyltransferase [Candidatus Hydrogenedentota bacterium]